MKLIYLIFFTVLTLILFPSILNNTSAAGDGKAPVTSYSPSGTVGLNSWYKSNVTVTLTCSDTGSPASGCKETYYCIESNTGTACDPLNPASGGITSTTNPTVFTVTQDGNHKIRWRSIDNSGLLEGESNKSFKIDKTAPTTTGYKAQWKSDDTGSWKDYDPPFDPNEWYSASEIPKDDNIYFSYTCSDPDNTGKGNNSKCKETLACFSTDGTCTPVSLTDTRLKVDQDGANIVRYSSRDNAGNDEAIRTYTAKRDITPPTYNYKIANFNQNLSKTITITCQDSTSGCKEIKYCTNTTFNKCTPTTLYTSPVTIPSTARSFSLSVTDIAGNSATHDQKLYIVPGQDACKVRVYKDNGSGSVVAAEREYVSSGEGNSDVTLVAGQSYFVENTIDPGFYENGAEAHTHKIWELDPSKTNKDGNNFYFFNTTDDVGENDGNGLETLHGTWNPVTGQDISDNLLKDPDSTVYNGKEGPWRWKFTPEVTGETTFDVFFGNQTSDDEGRVTTKRCHRTTNIVTITTPPPGEFEITSVEPQCVSQTPEIKLTWSPSANADFYEIWRSDSLSLPIATNIPSNQLTYTDTNVQIGTEYSYLLYAKKNSGGEQTSSGWSSPASPPDCSDTTPPTTPTIDVGVQVGDKCYSTGSQPDPWPGSFSVETSDPESGIATVTYKLQENPLSSGNCYNGSSFSSSCSDPTADNLISDSISPYTVSFPTEEFTAGNQYSVSATATNNADLSSTSVPYYFDIKNSCAKPSLKTTGGDVHSNEEITLPEP